MAIYPTPEQLQKLMAGPADQPVVMINLLRFKPRADAADEGVSGEEAYQRYATRMREFVESKGGHFGEGFHVAGLVEYPSRKAFLEIVSDPYVQKDIGAHREAGLESQWLLAATGMRLTD